MAKSARIDDDGNVFVTIALTTSGCPLRAQIQRDVRARVGGLPGVAHVKIEWTEMTREEKSSATAQARWHVSQRPEDTALRPTPNAVRLASGQSTEPRAAGKARVRPGATRL